MTSAPKNPALPTTQPSRKYMITPRMVKTSGVNTPPNAPNFLMNAFSSGFLDDLAIYALGLLNSAGVSSAIDLIHGGFNLCVSGKHTEALIIYPFHGV
jgi:hypothetical protein